MAYERSPYGKTILKCRPQAIAALPPPPAFGKCNFPLWADGDKPDHRYCLRSVQAGKTMCDEHHRLCYYKISFGEKKAVEDE